MKPDYEMIGRWLGNRRVEKEIGYPVYNDPETMWAVIHGEGFITYRERGQIDALYVEPECRRRGVGRTLVNMALTSLANIGCRRVRVSANANSRHLFASAGFKTVSVSKNFTRMERYDA